MCVSVFPISSPIVLCDYLLDLEFRVPPKHQSGCGYTDNYIPDGVCLLFAVGISLDLGLCILQPFIFCSSLWNSVAELFHYPCSFLHCT